MLFPQTRCARARAPGRPVDLLACALALTALVGAGCEGCTDDGKTPISLGLSIAEHSERYFPIDSGPHAVACAQCHTQPENFSFNCLACHEHEPVATDLLHETTADYAYESPQCYTCHPRGVQRPIFDHFPGRTQCAVCHDEGAAFAALPKPNFTHPERGSIDCSACHLSVVDWAEVNGVPTTLTSDPLAAIEVSALLPRYAGTSMVSATPTVETLQMPMDHTSGALDPTIVANCASCHVEQTNFYPGKLHSSLANLLAAQPTSCADCHTPSAPLGFVGPPGLDPPRDPSTGEMKHDAVAWVNDVPTTSGLVPVECGLCHQPPSQALAATWAEGLRAPEFHAPLDAAALPQPDSCLDCHANARPAISYSIANAPMPVGVSFDHASAEAQTDCARCHSTSTTTWASGRYHSATEPTPSTCLPCHEGERPTATDTWADPSFRAAPFDFVDNVMGIGHGANQDCVLCHAGAGTGTFGVDQNWQRGNYDHDPGTEAGTTCIACHTTQRPDLVIGNDEALLGFSHATDGTGDCFGCHQASVAANAYASYFNVATGTLPGGDWAGGVTYPGDFPIGSLTEFFQVTEIKLLRSGANNLVTGTSSITATLYNQMLHTSAALPAQLDAGSPTNPDETVCWHCHTNTNGTVTSLINGVYHSALDNFRTTPGGALAPLAQPTSNCVDCHAAPVDIVQAGASFLQPMDHAAVFTAPVTIGGRSVAGVAAMDCGTCHTAPGDRWDDGSFHDRIAAAVPQDCTVCHYTTMANRAAADVASGTTFSMRHASVSITVQNCQSCHTTALANGDNRPLAATLWTGGALHAHVTPQPGACLECHSSSEPAGRTQSGVGYVLAQGGTATNGGQYMTHLAVTVAARDCVSCHAADARASGAAWSTSTPFHQNTLAGVTTCRECHGGGGAAGASNNMPAGLTDSAVLTSASSNPATGVAAGTHAQLTHDDANVTGHDCNFCHTQVGPAASGPARGVEWRQASFHARFTGGNPLALNGSTGRCSNCHMNVKPGAAYPVDHSTFSNSPGTTDCTSCHSWPGTGTPAAPNWLGADGGAPVFITVGGFLVPQPPATSSPTFEANIANLPHPATDTGVACTACHADGGGKRAIGYDHASTLISGRCSACHEAGTDLVGSTWNGSLDVAGGAGDSRPFTIDVMTVSAFGRTLDVPTANHFYPTDCFECHGTPSGLSTATTGAAYDAAWSFPHEELRMTSPDTCILCHGADGLLPTDLVSDPAKNLDVTAQIPTYAGTTMVSATATLETLPMPMDHLTGDVSAAVMASCTNCHDEPTTYFPGTLHSALANLALTDPSVVQPTACASCHLTSMPTGFVGPPDPPRSPLTGAMKHDAVVWLNDAPTTSGLVPLECNTCHDPPSQQLFATWAVGAQPATFHAALDAAGLPDASSCIDCHANSRATGVQSGAPLPSGVTFDHDAANAQTDCFSCHASGTYTSWTDGRFHRVGDATPSTCLPCHSGERPTSNAGWQSTTYTRSPFDYGTNSLGITHGDGQDCVECHSSSGTGSWGVNQNWQNGFFDHAAGSVAGETCIACHTTQRADLVVANSAALLGFDHATAGTGDCIGCHQETVTAGAYVRLLNAQNTLPGGDWAGGISYPGNVLISSQDQFVTLSELILVRSGPNNLVTSTSSISATFYNAMLHTSSALPASLNGGPPGNPDSTTCWHCHTNVNGTVTSFANGDYHGSLDTFRNTPGGALAPIPQPTGNCLDCHAQMHPGHIVRKNGSFLQPMDHDSPFVSAVTLGGKSVTNVNAVDCGVCHSDPGGSWSDGQFHANIGAAQPTDCTLCHYPTVANTATSDLRSGTVYQMRHASAQLTFQNCKTCHTNALARGAQTPIAATLWSGGTLHPHTSPQPTGCLDCHSISVPSTTTQGSVVYTLAQGGTASNGAQWMSHSNTYVTGRDCVLCHQADAKTSGSAWSKASPFHSKVASTTCALCHGITNGRGTTVGTNNNMPAGLNDSSKTSSAAGVAGTGIPAGTKDQIAHTDVNVTGHDCNFCHTQVGPSTVAGIQGREWAQASFHTKFTAASPLLMNGTTGRCSNCHMNIRPAAGFSFDHTSFTNVSGSTDCVSCHSWPGTGNATSPNWLGAAGGFPPIIATGGFLVRQPPAANATTTEAAIANLPHPTPAATACTACHTSAAGGKQATGYDHASTLITKKCSSCHEAGSNLVNPVWNNATAVPGAGDTRPFSIANLRVTYKGNSLTVTGGNHFYPVDCNECHNAPTGVVNTSTGTTYTTRWRFPHTERNMTNPATCRLCHGNNIPD